MGDGALSAQAERWGASAVGTASGLAAAGDEEIVMGFEMAGEEVVSIEDREDAPVESGWNADEGWEEAEARWGTEERWEEEELGAEDVWEEAPVEDEAMAQEGWEEPLLPYSRSDYYTFKPARRGGSPPLLRDESPIDTRASHPNYFTFMPPRRGIPAEYRQSDER
mmetsp:Transcript_46170/g.105806  ORF Transcript_46170/g.105806 Transcript_46170/m.105806 type:complete len:166 (-) Transcript_46170:167-664(-)